MRLPIAEFIRRFLVHVLPQGFVRIRYYGLMAGVNVSTKLEQCRRLLGRSATAPKARPNKTWIERLVEWTGQQPLRCPQQPCSAPCFIEGGGHRRDRHDSAASVGEDHRL
jgi:hypothetical protein